MSILLSALLSGCALLDLAPENGYPYRESERGDYVELSPESIFDFHSNPTF